MMKRVVTVLAAALFLVGRGAGAQEVKLWPSERRPAALPFLYVGYGVLQGLDVHTTARAIEAGAREGNPLLKGFNARLGATIAVKAATGTATIFAVERLWKRNRVAAIALMAGVNGVTAAVAVYNVRVARAQRAR